MEINSTIPELGLQKEGLEQEVKPLKGFNATSEVQRFEQILFNEQQHVLKNSNPIENTDTSNAVNKLGQAFFDQVGNFKKSIDLRMANSDNILHSTQEVNAGDLLRLQWDMTLYEVETTIVTKCGGKVADGIQTLFRTQ